VKHFSHFDESGKARMVDVSDKPETFREALAEGIIRMKPHTLRLIKENKIVKGDVLTVAKVAGIFAAKKTGSLIPMAHPLNISGCEISFKFSKKPGFKNRSERKD
jgi:GTP cyclohydrolase subunit MoaC